MDKIMGCKVQRQAGILPGVFIIAARGELFKKGNKFVHIRNQTSRVYTVDAGFGPVRDVQVIGPGQ